MEFSAKERQDFIVDEATEIRDDLKNNKENPIDTSLSPVPPFIGTVDAHDQTKQKESTTEEIKIIIIGQDPTVGSIATRKKIKTTLMLDDKNAELTKYIEKQICEPLGLSLANVYATNLFKYFYAHRPTSKNVDILKSHLEPNLKLLKDELKQYHNVTIIALGQPVLQLLTYDKNELKRYRGYDKKTPNHISKKEGALSYVLANDNKLGVDFYPFPHLNTYNRSKNFKKNNKPAFYFDQFIAYLDLVK